MGPYPPSHIHLVSNFLLNTKERLILEKNNSLIKEYYMIVNT